MAYHLDPNGDIVIDGFENGVGDSPYSGLSDIRNINISSIPGEASVNFQTISKTPAIVTGTVVAGFQSGATGISYTGGVGLENGMAIVFSNLSNTGLGITNNTPYWIVNLGIGGSGLTGLASNYELTSIITISGTSLTGTFASYNMSTPKYIVKQGNWVNYNTTNVIYFMIDSAGLVWSNKNPTTSGAWTYTGNTTLTGANGNGLVYYQTSDTTIGYVFAFRGAVIDYFKVTNPNSSTPSAYSISWTYGWNPNTGTTAQTTGLKSAAGSGNSHEAWVMPDNRVYFCDASNVGKFFETTGTIFDPANTATYTYTTYPLLPLNDVAQCIAPSGTNILIGGGNNVVYSWNRTATLINFSYLIAESNIVKMITVNTNTYIFTGNRGRIYVTNGAQAQLFKKVPDHLSNTVEPYYAWGGVCVLKNRIYFGIASTDNAGTRNQIYGGVWSVDLDTKALILANELTYGTYAGNATALLGNSNPTSSALGQPYPNSNPVGTGLVIGWDNTFFGVGSGIDVSIGTPYTGGQSYIISDMLPIGTLFKPTTPLQYEYKLAVPLLASETVELQVAPFWNGTYTSVGTTTGTASTSAVILSDNFSGKTQNHQWLAVKCILTGKSSNPSYNRLKEIRIIGATSPQTSMPTIA